MHIRQRQVLTSSVSDDCERLLDKIDVEGQPWGCNSDTHVSRAESLLSNYLMYEIYSGTSQIFCKSLDICIVSKSSVYVCIYIHIYLI